MHFPRLTRFGTKYKVRLSQEAESWNCYTYRNPGTEVWPCQSTYSAVALDVPEISLHHALEISLVDVTLCLGYRCQLSLGQTMA